MTDGQYGISVLFVCLGNICRSPTAHGVFQNLIEQQGLSDTIYVDSAGTGNWHLGKPPDSRSIQTALDHDLDLNALRARLFVEDDFERFDYILAMDRKNLEDISKLKPLNFKGFVGLFLSFASETCRLDVPDPYFSGNDGFELVFDLVTIASRGLLNHIRHRQL